MQARFSLKIGMDKSKEKQTNGGEKIKKSFIDTREEKNDMHIAIIF